MVHQDKIAASAVSESGGAFGEKIVDGPQSRRKSVGLWGILSTFAT